MGRYGKADEWRERRRWLHRGPKQKKEKMIAKNNRLRVSCS
jgi:hypothetical protein